MLSKPPPSSLPIWSATPASGALTQTVEMSEAAPDGVPARDAPGNAESADGRDHRVDDDRGADRADHPAGQGHARPGRLAQQVGDDLEPREGHHRQRDRVRQGVPGRGGADVQRAGELVRVEDQRQAEHRQECPAPGCRGSPRSTEPAYSCGRRTVRIAPDEHGQRGGQDLVVRVLEAVQGVERRERVVRDEQQRQRDDHDEVEQHRPADDEARDVAECPPGDRRRSRRPGRPRARPRRRRRRPARTGQPAPSSTNGVIPRPRARRRRGRSRATTRSPVDDRVDRLGAEDALQSGSLRRAI